MVSGELMGARAGGGGWQVPISMPEAVMGGTIIVPTLGGDIEMQVSPGTQSGETRRLRGRGIKLLRGRGAGDQYVRFKVVIPKGPELTEDQRELLSSYSEAW
eukprot:SAG25_NODE_102_length_15486_cov_22.883278_7_plen_102_part_00